MRPLKKRNREWREKPAANKRCVAPVYLLLADILIKRIKRQRKKRGRIRRPRSRRRLRLRHRIRVSSSKTITHPNASFEQRVTSISSRPLTSPPRSELRKRVAIWVITLVGLQRRTQDPGMCFFAILVIREII